MLYFIAFFVGAVIGFVITAIITAGTREEELAFAYEKGYRKGRADGFTIKAKTGGEVFFICDRRACEPCRNEQCKFTRMIEHAANFETIGDAYWEKEK